MQELIKVNTIHIDGLEVLITEAKHTTNINAGRWVPVSKYKTALFGSYHINGLEVLKTTPVPHWVPVTSK